MTHDNDQCLFLSGFGGLAKARLLPCRTPPDAWSRRPGHQLTYSVGWDLSGRERAALRLVPGRLGGRLGINDQG
jgi:hypothetical protein